MDRRSVSTGSPFEPLLGLSRAVRVGNVIAVSGTAPLGPDGKTVCVGDAAGQARRCFEIAAAALEQLGAGLSDVVRTRILVTRGGPRRGLPRYPPRQHRHAGRPLHRPRLAGGGRGGRDGGGGVRRPTLASRRASWRLPARPWTASHLTGSSRKRRRSGASRCPRPRLRGRWWRSRAAPASRWRWSPP